MPEQLASNFLAMAQQARFSLGAQQLFTHPSVLRCSHQRQHRAQGHAAHTQSRTDQRSFTTLEFQARFFLGAHARLGLAESSGAHLIVHDTSMTCPPSLSIGLAETSGLLGRAYCNSLTLYAPAEPGSPTSRDAAEMQPRCRRDASAEMQR